MTHLAVSPRMLRSAVICCAFLLPCEYYAVRYFVAVLFGR
jgi:hypothetical protein